MTAGSRLVITPLRGDRTTLSGGQFEIAKIPMWTVRPASAKRDGAHVLEPRPPPDPFIPGLECRHDGPLHVQTEPPVRTDPGRDVAQRDSIAADVSLRREMGVKNPEHGGGVLGGCGDLRFIRRLAGTGIEQQE